MIEDALRDRRAVVTEGPARGRRRRRRRQVGRWCEGLVNVAES